MKLQFELQTRSQLVVETQFCPYPIPLKAHQEKISQFFGHALNRYNLTL